ncbi:hypothetical protein GCM10023238_02140 [Streptomyces heliomycini]
MAHLRSRRRLALAVTVVLSLTASLGFLPAAGLGGPADGCRRAGGGRARPGVRRQHQDGPPHDRLGGAGDRRWAGGKVVVTYDRIGVIVVHSADPDFGEKIRKARGVQSAGAPAPRR